MTAINFPDNPDVDDLFTVNDRTWKWTGSTWDTVEELVVGPTGPQGPPGEQGETGPQGVSISIKGTVDDVEDLPATGNSINDAYIVSADGDLYIWEGTEWNSVGQIVGPQGPQGIQGETGPQGEQGIQGEEGPAGQFGGATFEYEFDDTTTHTEILGNGLFRFNNATPASATELFIAFIDGNGADIFNFLQTIDDSTSQIKGNFKVTKKSDTNEFAFFSITGSHSHHDDHFHVPIAFLSANGFTPADGEDFYLTFQRTGDIGDTGPQGEQGIQGEPGPQGEQGETGTGGVLGYYGSFYDMTDQSLASITAAQPISIGTVSEASGISIENDDEITFEYDGTYSMTFSIQITNLDNAIAKAVFWVKKNGVDYPDSATEIDLPPGKNSTTPNRQVITINYVATAEAGDYVQVFWAGDSTDLKVESLPAGTNPVYPAVPSIILTAVQVMYTQAGPQGEPGVAGEPGEPGPPGDDGETGVVFQDEPPVSTNILWVDTDEDVIEIPSGGDAGQVLAKIDSDDFNTEWVDVTSIPDIDDLVVASTFPIKLNEQIILADYSIPVGYNGLSAGPITIDDGVVVTIPAGSSWSVV
jgi:hypothetical protein